jgi:glutaredoxin-like YruB-family protein
MDVPNVKIYTTPTCAFCHAVKEFFRENNVKFSEFDVAVDEKAREEMIQKTGQLEVPVIDINGKLIVGFQRVELAELLGIKK